MRGKIIVLAMLTSAAALLIYSLWFVGNHSPADQRFNMRRMALAADAPGAMALPPSVGEFTRTELAPGTLDSATAGRSGSAEYIDYTNAPVRLEVTHIGSGAAGQALFADFAARAGAAEGEGRNISLRQYDESRPPYGLGIYSATTYTYYEFAWRSGEWLLRASTRTAGVEALLRFVNSYRY
jgi:hypothetical protein